MSVTSLNLWRLSAIRETAALGEREALAIAAQYAEIKRAAEQLAEIVTAPEMTEALALTLLRSGQMTEADYVQRAEQEGWGT